MKRIAAVFLFFIFISAWIFRVFSFDIDGLDSGIEWDGATSYTLIDGESNCGINFGLVKVKFDHETSALLLCFHFIDPDMERDNQNAGITISVEDSPEFGIVASHVTRSENIPPYSFDGAIGVYEFNGATCEVRVGFKSGLPEKIDCKVRFVDSQGYYSNYYDFTVVNENYSPPETQIVFPTADNSDSAYNPDADKVITSKKKSTTKKSTTKKEASNTNSEKTQTEFVIKTSPPYSYTGRKTTKRVRTEKPTTVKITKPEATKKETVKVYYYEKEVYISEVYITETIKPTDLNLTESSAISETSTEISLNNTEISYSSKETVSLTQGSKYKKIISGASLAAFVLLAVFGAYSAKKNTNGKAEDNHITEDNNGKDL